MSVSLLVPPTNSSPEVALRLSQQTQSFFRSQLSWLSRLPYPLSLFINSESQEQWQIYENMFLACLRAGKNEAAHICLSKISTRFGMTNERAVALHGMYQEAMAKDDAELQEVLQSYEDVIKEDPTMFSVCKRRAALLRSMGRTNDAIEALTSLLNVSTTDAEAWSELSDLYLTQGAYEQAVFCLEEVLLTTPNAWNMHAKLGEVLYLSAVRMDSGTGDQLKLLSESMRRFCRSIELCDDYLRGYYGLKLTTSRLLQTSSNSKKSQVATTDPVAGDLAPPSIDAVTKLNEVATAKLVEIKRKFTAREKGWDGYNPAEIEAVGKLIDQDIQKVAR